MSLLPMAGASLTCKYSEVQPAATNISLPIAHMLSPEQRPAAYERFKNSEQSQTSSSPPSSPPRSNSSSRGTTLAASTTSTRPPSLFPWRSVPPIFSAAFTSGFPRRRLSQIRTLPEPTPSPVAEGVAHKADESTVSCIPALGGTTGRAGTGGSRTAAAANTMAIIPHKWLPCRVLPMQHIPNNLGPR